MEAPAGPRASAGDGGGLSFSSARSPPLLTATAATAGAAGPGHVRSDPVPGRLDLDSRWPVRLRGRRRVKWWPVAVAAAAEACDGAGGSAPSACLSPHGPSCCGGGRASSGTGFGQGGNLLACLPVVAGLLAWAAGRATGRQKAVPAVVVKTEAAAASWGAGFGAWCPDPAVPGQGAAPKMVGHTPCCGWRRGRLRHRRVPGPTKMVSGGLVVRHWDASGGARSGYAWPGRRG